MSSSETKVCFFTIVSKNYTHYARTLISSIKEHYPGADLFVALCDKPDGIDYADEPYALIKLEELDNIPDRHKFLFRHTILELNTAIKPYVIEKLFDRGYGKVFYIDPDIRFYSNLTPMVKLLDQHQVLLTPHLTGLLDDDKTPSELDILRSGTYNLGYIGLRNTSNTRKLVSWWQNKLYKDCIVDLNRGLFVDQKWMDMVPGIFEDVHVCRHEGWNVAYWNLHHRHVEVVDDEYKANDQELVFFHFSGFSPESKNLSKHQNRFTRQSAGTAVAKLCDDYARDLNANGYESCKSLKYEYGYFPDGTYIPDFARYVYRDEMNWEIDQNNLWELEGAQNFMGFLNEAVTVEGKLFPHLTRLSHRLYRAREDLIAAFPDLMGIDGIRYAHWYVDNAEEQAQFAECFIAPVRSAIDQKKKQPPGLNRDWFYHLVYRIARKFRTLARPFFSDEFRSRINIALIRKSNSGFDRSLEYARPGLQKTTLVDLEDGVNLYGYVHAESGIGQSARANIASLTAAGIPLSVIDVRFGNISRMQAHVDDHLKGQPKYKINLFHINADQMETALRHLGLEILDGHYNIGFWAWELPEFPDEWVPACNFLDEIWTPSTFCRDAIAEKVSIPVHIIPHAIWADAVGFDKDDRSDRGEDFYTALLEDRFTFITMFDCLSVPERKNITAALDAFEIAFGRNNERVQLVVKVTNLESDNQFSQALRERSRQNNAIRIISDYLDRAQLLKLLAESDCFVSLHRSEGYGLGIAEAMLLGKVVIATGWSGNMDFCKPDNSLLVDYTLVQLEKDHGPYKKGQTWAEPSITHAAELMQKVTAGGPELKLLGTQAASYVEKYLSPATVGQMLRERTEQIIQGKETTTGKAD